jgi:hypothetical protein
MTMPDAVALVRADLARLMTLMDCLRAAGDNETADLLANAAATRVMELHEVELAQSEKTRD